MTQESTCDACDGVFFKTDPADEDNLCPSCAWMKNNPRDADAAERVREGSWLGSERNRREQGVCLPPLRAAKKAPRYFVPALTKCSVSAVSPRRWRDYTTTKDLGFERYETADKWYVTFRERGFLLQVQWRYVRGR